MDHHPETNPADPLAELFPGPAHLGRPRRRTARRVVAGGAAVALLALGGAAVAAAGADDEGGYRTATAATREVSQVLDRVGTIEPVSQASVAFPVGGTVSWVGVQVGDTVIVGQELADLDVTELTRTLHDREATLAQAELVLQKALDGEDVSGLTGGSRGSGAAGGAAPSGSSSSGSAKGISWDTASSAKAQAQTVALPTASSTTTAPGAGSSGAGDAEVRAAQQAVLDAQQAVDRDLAAAQVALDTATEVCAAVGSPTEGTPSTSSTSSTSSTGSTTSTTTSTAPPASTPDGSGIEACRSALAAVLDAQALVAADQAALADASRALDALLADRATSSGSSSGGTGGTGSVPSGGTSGSSAGAGGTSSSGSTPSAGSGSATSTASAEDLVAYQKAVDAAAAQVAAAEQALDQARVVSPIAGTVVSVGLAVGDEVTAGSATAAVVVAGAGGFEVTTHVSVDDVPDLEVGQTATVLPDGSTTAVRGEVVRIGAADTSSGSASYPVTIGLEGDTGDLGNGSVASVEIVTAAATRALAVPVSAVTVDGDRHTVTVLDGSTTRTVEVEVGAVGQRWVEVTDGLDAGDEVVLADLSEALPSSATEAREQQQGGTTRSFGPGGGSFTPPQGFTGGRPPGN